MKLRNIIFESKLVAAGGEYRRLLANGGIKVDGVVIEDEGYTVPDGVHFIEVGRSKELLVSIINSKLIDAKLFNDDNYSVTILKV